MPSREFTRYHLTNIGFGALFGSFACAMIAGFAYDWDFNKVNSNGSHLGADMFVASLFGVNLGILGMYALNRKMVAQMAEK